MAGAIRTRLSSDFLYTYTQQLNTIKLMLKFGFRHSLNIERIPYKNSEQHNFIVCFCDILPEQAAYHKGVYGSYAISLTKEWGIGNGVTPLRYIHQNSPGAHADYIKWKNDMRIARASLQDGNQIDYFLSLLTFIKAREDGRLTEDSIHEQQNVNPIDDYLEQLDEQFARKRDRIGDTILREIFNDWVIPIIHLLEKSVNELERRDAFLRIYQDDFRHIRNKVLYDEREWRSVKFISEADVQANAGIADRVRADGFLPRNYNLTFSVADINAIIVETEAEKEELRAYIAADVPDLAAAADKVVTFAEHTVIP